MSPSRSTSTSSRSSPRRPWSGRSWRTRTSTCAASWSRNTPSTTSSARARGCRRSSRRFLSINCGAMPENLLESELFGHERGAFTGAVRDKKGLFQEADRGTLFLDEIGEMTPSMQVKLLRALQEKVVRKVGGTEEEPVDARIIAASNQDLEARLQTGEFREDLYYRINVLPIHLPPLRQRREDIPLLVDFFLGKYSRQMELPPRQISIEAMHILEAYDWPGNVRELENLIERVLALSHAETITTRDLPVHLLTNRRNTP